MTGPADRALLADGAGVVLRRLAAADGPAVDALHRDLPRDDRYLRFFTVSRFGAERVADVVVAPDSTAVGAFRGDRLVGVAHYRHEPAGVAPEVALAVAHAEQHRGVASLLLERLVSAARAEGVERFVAEVLAVNADMLAVLRDSGLPMRTRLEGDVCRVELDLPPTSGSGPEAQRYLDAVVERAARADVASLRPLLAPRSVVVFGAGRRPDSVGRLVLRRIVGAGFTGPVHVVHPHAAAVGGVPCVPGVADLPRDIDLAVLCVPAAAVPEVAEQCGRHGVRGLLVITAGVTGDPALAGGLSAAVTRHGMRMVGPNCLGLADTDPAERLQASFAAPLPAGSTGLAVQSGGVLIALAAVLDRLGLGVSTAVSTGDSTDVNADDLLLWWAADGRTRAAALYVESMRRPRQFARLARRLARRIPVLTVRSGSSDAGRRAAASHSASTATPRVVRDALFAQAGVLAADDLTDLTALLALVQAQPLPTGPRVAVVSNAGGAGVLAADACARHGLETAPLRETTRAALAALLPPTAAVADPVDTTATVPAATFARVVETVLADPAVDAVVAISAATALGDPLDALDTVLDGRPGRPVVAVRLGQPEAVARSHRTGPWTPSFADPATAVRALAGALGRARWLERGHDPVPAPPGVCDARARAVVDAALAERPEGGWLDPARTVELARAAGLPVVPTTVVHTAQDAVRCWEEAGGPVALKADVEGVVHKSRAGAVRLGLDSARRVRDAAAGLRTAFGDRLRGIVVQPMQEPGPELLVGITGDPLCGPLLTLGLGGTATDLVDDRTHCLVPATAADLDELLGGLRAARLLLGRDDAGALRRAVHDVVTRMGWLAEQLPGLVEAEINPLVWSSGAVRAVDLRARVVPTAPDDPYLRVLPT